MLFPIQKKWKTQKLELEKIKTSQALSLRKTRVLSGHGHKPMYSALE
ncbi:24626_t:CDS:2 [Cetraspora pellucida]|uniref:24626_t:CDS:1 n=1 Tax=Cetraspora pellucida TaxID=1433469 RepID=A0A9N9AKS8_9GLOM|nr:24626_t:CDS:2 [Cetraspora pellucida]